ncbi:hypothetical protein ABCR94_30270 [Streptomyces sp. 21So2-11]|uniref:hypothetical protein n=1 Tax=Streptomyces sp. 21So2-11 TaxID=3144408 RepID=UPI00321B7FF5
MSNTAARTALRGPYWVTVRQHSRVLMLFAALTLAGIGALIGYQGWASGLAETFAASGCSVSMTTSECSDDVRSHLDNSMAFTQLLDYLGLAMIALPGLVGAYVAGPMIARELESGTYKLAWTQSVSPARWFAAKLAVPTVLSVAGVSLLSAAHSWARSTPTDDMYPAQWYERIVFGATGTVPVAYTLLGLALGALIGVAVRRTVPAMSAAALTAGALVLAVSSQRGRLWPVETVTAPMPPATPDSVYPVEQGMLTGTGTRIPEDACWSRAGELGQCMTDHDITAWYRDYHPESHFWPLQLVETGIVLALAALAVAAAFRVLRSRHA